MGSARDRLETILRESRPNAFCFTCIASILEVSVLQVRDAAQLLVVDPEFRFRPRRLSCVRARGRGSLVRPLPMLLAQGFKPDRVIRVIELATGGFVLAQ
jgi:hypothetical protein